MDYAQVAENITNVLGQTGWAHFSDHKPVTGICLGMAIGRVYTSDRDGRQEVASKVAAVIGEQFPERATLVTRHPMATIVNFNDHKDTTRADIDLVLGKLAVA